MNSHSTSRSFERPRLRIVADGAVESRPGDEAAGLNGLSDEELVALVRANDRPAFEVLYRRHAPFALNLAVRIQGAASDVEDVVHDAFLKAHRGLDGLRDDAAFRSWLGSIVVSLVRSRLRRRRFLSTVGVGERDVFDLDALAAEDAGPETRAQIAQVYRLLQELPLDCRIAWTLKHVERHTLPEVARMTDCSLATVKRRIARAERQIGRSLFGDDEGTEDRTDAENSCAGGDHGR